MAERNKKTQAIIFSLRQSGEQNRIVTAFSPEMGIFSCILYGGPKSKLRSLVQPFNSGTIYLYCDETKKSIKISDFDATNCHISLRENLYKSCAATLACEIVMKTKCAGDNESAFTLLKALLDGMDIVDETEARLGMLRFLWRYIGLLGIQCDVKTCASCGKFLLSENIESFYVDQANLFVCKDCIPYFSSEIKLSTKLIPLDLNALTYLAAINELTPGKVRSLLLPQDSAYRMKQFLYHLIEKASETKLETLATGSGIL